MHEKIAVYFSFVLHFGIVRNPSKNPHYLIMCVLDMSKFVKMLSQFNVIMEREMVILNC